jgi:hypothetical protein
MMTRKDKKMLREWIDWIGFQTLPYAKAGLRAEEAFERAWRENKGEVPTKYREWLDEMGVWWNKNTYQIISIIERHSPGGSHDPNKIEREAMAKRQRQKVVREWMDRFWMLSFTYRAAGLTDREVHKRACREAGNLPKECWEENNEYWEWLRSPAGQEKLEKTAREIIANARYKPQP